MFCTARNKRIRLRQKEPRAPQERSRGQPCDPVRAGVSRGASDVSGGRGIPRGEGVEGAAEAGSGLGQAKSGRAFLQAGPVVP